MCWCVRVGGVGQSASYFYLLQLDESRAMPQLKVQLACIKVNRRRATSSDIFERFGGNSQQREAGKTARESHKNWHKGGRSVRWSLWTRDRIFLNFWFFGVLLYSSNRQKENTQERKNLPTENAYNVRAKNNTVAALFQNIELLRQCFATSCARRRGMPARRLLGGRLRPAPAKHC